MTLGSEPPKIIGLGTSDSQTLKPQLLTADLLRMASREWTEESSKTPELRRRESAEEGRSFNYRHATVYDAVAGNNIPSSRDL